MRRKLRHDIHNKKLISHGSAALLLAATALTWWDYYLLLLSDLQTASLKSLETTKLEPKTRRHRPRGMKINGFSESIVFNSRNSLHKSIKSSDSNTIPGNLCKHENKGVRCHDGRWFYFTMPPTPNKCLVRGIHKSPIVIN